MPDTMMRAIEISEPGGPKALQVCTRAIPQPSKNEILIGVKAAGINRPDVLQRMGAYPAPEGASNLPGLEVAGIVKAVGESVTKFRIGDPVCALVAGGGYAQFCSVDAGSVLPIPAGLTMVQAAALPETFFTVWHNVFACGGLVFACGGLAFACGGLRKGDFFLVHGGSSGIGTTAIQLAKAFGATVITTVGSQEKADACRKLGADHVIEYRNTDFVSAVKEITGGLGANVILDMVGGDYIDRNYSCAAVDGRIVQIAFLNGAKAEANFSKLMMKRLTHTGSTLRARSLDVKAAIAEQLKEHVWPLIENGQIAPVMDMIFPLNEAWRAHERMEEGAHIGKIVLDVA